MVRMTSGPLHEAETGLQSPDWRWQLAMTQVAQAEGLFCRSTDRTVLLAKQYYRGLGRCRDEAKQCLLAAGMPILAAAHAPYQDARAPARHALEARLLTGEPVAAIAEKSAMPAKVVSCYADLFFDVRGKLGQPDYILHQVLGPRLHGSAGSWDYDVAWKLFAYLGGVHVLEELMHRGKALAKPQNALEAAAFLSDASRAAIRRRMAVAAHALGASDQRTTAELLRLQAHLITKRDHEEGGDAASIWERHVKAFLDHIPFSIGEDGTKTLTPEVIEWDASAVELRTDELAKLAAGQKIPGLADLKTFRLPEGKTTKSGIMSDNELLLE